MNKFYRSLWNDITRTFVAVAETVSKGARRASSSGDGTGMAKSVLRTAGWMMLSTGVAHAAPPAPTQLPNQGRVVAGQATISQSGAQMSIQQASGRAVVDWGSFNVGSQASVNIQQPSSSSAILNRVLDANPSQIFGRINANGQVFLTNPSGIYFGQSANINVGALTATTHAIGNDDFMAGRLSFSRNGATGKIENHGSLNAGLGGYIALLAPEVRNSGVVVAQMGTVVLAAGEVYDLQFDNGRLTNIRTEPATIAALVENGHAVRAPGGLIILSAHAADKLQGSVVRSSGELSASSLTERGGVIRLEGDHITLASTSRTEAGGSKGGGEVLVGGGWQGGGDQRQAVTTTMEPGATIDVSATQAGDGGTAVLWSDIRNPLSQTRAQGSILARGGAQAGDGGRIETSGHWLDVQGIRAEASAPQGRAGSWLVDPYNVTIGAAASGTAYASNFTPGADSTILASDVAASLNGGTSVTITTGNGGSSAGNITVASAITKSAGNTDVTLTLQAANHIVIDQVISNTGGAGKLNVVLDADNNNGTRAGSGVIFLNNSITTGGGNLSFGTGATATVNGVSTRAGGDVFVAGSSALSLSTGGGNVAVNGDMFIANANGLNISTGGGSVTFAGMLNSGNSYSLDATARTWFQANTAASTGSTTGRTSVGDRYLATITSKVEDAMVARAVGSGEAWVGALGGNYSDSSGGYTLWRWISPETAPGNEFFRAGTAVAGKYNNWATGAQPARLVGGSGGVTEAVYVDGSVAKWRWASSINDPSASTTKRASVVETNLASSPLTINTGTGAVTFAGEVGGVKPIGALSVTAGSIAINGGVLSTAGASTFAGDITLGSSSTVLSRTEANADFILQPSKTITNATGANASLTIRANRDIVLEDSSAISSATGRLDVTLNSDTDGSGGGAILLRNNVSISSNGGAIKLGGGTSGNALDNAVGAQTPNQNSAPTYLSDDAVGIRLGRHTSSTVNANVTLSSGGGEISLRGEGGAGNVNSVGVLIAGGTTIDSGAGAVQIYGYGKGSGSSPNTAGHGVEFAFAGPNSGVKIYANALSPLTAINIYGDASASTNPNRSGISASYGSDKNQIVSDDGTVILTGRNNAGYGISLQNFDILSKRGYIKLDGGVAGVETKQTSSGQTGPVNIGYGDKSGSPVTSSSSQIDLLGNQIVLDGATRVQSSGSLTVAPSTNSATIGLAGGAGTLQIPAAYLTINFVPGFDQGLSIGSNSTTGTITTGALAAAHEQLKLTTKGSVAIGGALDVGSNQLTIFAGGGATQAAPITAGNLALYGGFGATRGNFTLTNPGNRVAAIGGSTGALRFVNAEALNVGVLSPVVKGIYGYQGVDATGPVAIETLSGNLSLSFASLPEGALPYGAPPQNILKTTDTSMSAVVLNAGSSAAAGTATGGNILLSDASSIAAGAGARVTLFSGSAAGSTGVGDFVGVGSGRFRYNSDETATNYTAALGTGSYAIFREQPLLKVTPSSASNVYGDAMSLAGVTYQVVGVNGDNATTAGVAGTPTFSTTATNTSNAGSYEIAYVSGLTNTVGYGMVDNASSTGEYTVTPRPISVVAASQSRMYGSANPSAGTVTLSSGSLAGSDALGSATVTLQNTATATASAGTTHALTPSAQTFTVGNASNYQITYVDGTLTITPRPITVVAANQNRTYGSANPSTGSVTLTSGSLAGSDALGTATVTPQSTATTTANAGTTHTITPSAQTFTVGSAGNYSITYLDGTLSITPRPITVTADNLSRTYGSDNPTGTVTMSGGSLVGSDTLSAATVTVQSTATATANAGTTHTLTPSAQTFTAGNPNNYQVTYVNGTLTITPRPITVAAANQTRHYGSANPTTGAVTLTRGSLAGSDTLGPATLTPQSTATASVNAGTTHTLTPSEQTFTVGNASNYQISYVDGTLSITPRPITVTADNQRKMIGGQDPGLTWKLTRGGLVNGHTIIGSLVRESGETVADYPIRQGSLDVSSKANYALSFVDGTFSILMDPPPPPAPPGALLPGALAVVNLDPNKIINLAGTGLSSLEPGGGARLVSAGAAPAGLASRAPTPASATSAGIVVNVGNAASASASRTIAVSVPRDLATPGSAFSFMLPAEVADRPQGQGGGRVVVTTVQGDPNLPSWLTFNPDTKTVVATSIPDGALPFQVVVSVGSERFLVDISSPK